MSAYDDYQTVSQRWVREIPNHWDCFRIKRIFAKRNETNNPIITDCILSLTAKQGVVPYADKEGAGGNKPKSDLTKYCIARPDDLLVNCMNVVSGSAGVSRYFGAISPVYYALYPRFSCNVWYFHYIFRLMSFQRSLLGLGKGILMHESDSGKLNTVRMRISMDYLGGVKLPVPPRAEQDQIVRYLDWQVSKINKLIAAKKKQIALLKEREQQIVAYTVTHGINKSVETRDSGVDWIGEIPAHWEKIKIRRFCTLQNGISESGEFFTKGTPFVSYGDVYKHIILPEKVSGVANSTIEQQETFSVKKGDMFFTRTSETIDEIGMPTVCLTTIDNAVFSGFLIRVRPYKSFLSPHYLKHYLRYSGIQRYFARTMNIVIRASLGQNLLKELTVLVPPAEEQVLIAKFLDEVHERFDTIRQRIHKEIDTLHELRTRIISDVVTGQIDVRNIEVPDFEMVEEVDTDESVDEDEVLEEPEEQEEEA